MAVKVSFQRIEVAYAGYTDDCAWVTVNDANDGAVTLFFDKPEQAIAVADAINKAVAK